MLQIGNLQIAEPALLLAPMEDVTDVSFRHLCKQYGAGLMYTEFVASEALIRNIEKSFQKMRIDETERPVGIQLYGHDIDAMVESAKIATTFNPDLIDINYGCPVRKIATRGAGAGMLRDIPKMLKMTRAIVDATHLPVTVKTRLGWDDDSKIIVDLAEQLQDCGIKALTIHGRTRMQLYKGTADWTLIGQVKNNSRMHIPIIGNGDVDGPDKAKQMLDTYGVDALMIGRATYGRPWIFKEIKTFLETGTYMEPLSLSEKVDLARLHLQKSVELKGDTRGVNEIKRHLVNYFKALPDFKEYRIKLVTAKHPDALTQLFNDILVKYSC